MSKSDAEISLKVNMPPPNEFKRALAEFDKLAKGTKDSLAQMGTQVKDVAEGVRIMGERARYTGSGAVVKAVEGSFVEGYKGASTMDAKAAQVEKGLASLQGRVDKVKAALEAGEISEAEALKLVQKYVVEAKKAEEVTSGLVYTLEATKGDLAAAEGLDEMLAKFTQFRVEADGVVESARAMQKELAGQADAFAEQREALDASMPGYEQAAAELLKLENEYRGLAKAAGAVADKAADSVGKVQESLKAYDGSATAQEKTYGVIAEQQKKVAEVDGKLADVAAKRATNEQNRAAAAEKNAQKEADAKAKAAAKAEEQAKREEELAARREAREEEQAKRDAERAERERFAMSLSLLSKDELIKKLKELQAAREAAAAAGDNETYQKRTREFMAAREQMEKVNTQLNLTRMAWTQQAQMANQFAGSLTDVAGRLGNVGDAAAKGELDLVGMANGMQQVGTQFASMLQAGMGPLGALTLILQMAQAAWNKVKKEEMERMAQVKAFAEQQKALNELLRVNRVELEEFNRVKLNTEAVNALVEKHRDLNAELEKEVRNIDSAAEAELYRMGLTADAEEHKMRMQQADLGRKLARGEITQEAYDEQMAGLKLAMDKKRLERGTRKAQVEYDAASEKEAERRAAYQVTAEEVTGLKRERRGMKWGREYLGTYEEGRARAQKLIDEATANYERLREERGEDDGMTDDARIAMLDAINAAADYEQEAWKMVDEYFGAGHGMTLDEALMKYSDKLEDVDGKLAAAEELRKEAEAGLNAAVAEKDRLGLALERAETTERVEKGRLDEAFESEAETRAVRKEEKDKADKRARQLADLRNKADAMTEEELRAKLAAAREARKNAKDEHAREFAKAQVELYRGRLKGRRETERERIAAAGLENDLKGSAAARGAFEKLDLQGVMNTMDDGRLSKGEVRMLLRQLELARKAENAEAMALIRAIVEQAQASKKMNAETKRQVKKAFEK